MDFQYSPKVTDLQARLTAFMEAHIHPNEERFHREVATGNRWEPTALIEELKPRARGGPVEPVPARIRIRCGSHQYGIRAAVRDHGPRAVGAGGVQLQRARYRQHGGAGALRHRAAKKTMARTVAGRKNPKAIPKTLDDSRDC